MIDSKLIGLIRDNLTKPNIERELLQKTSVLSINKLTKAKCKLSVICFTSLLASCQPSYAIASTNQNLNNHSFNYVELVAVTGNNLLLSQSTSAAPQRQCGFFMSAIQQNGGIAPLCRVYTPKYDTRKGNMGSGTCTPRVKPDALTISTVSGVSQSSTR